MLFILLSVAVFIAAGLIDFVEAYYVKSVEKGLGHRAAMYSVSMYVIGCVGFFAVLEYSWWLMIPECLGLYFGTRAAVAKQNKENQASEE